MMIFSANTEPSIDEFRLLMKRTDDSLNRVAKECESYFQGKNGKSLEVEVYRALTESAEGTPFQGSIVLVSGAKFPDIVAKKMYGVEVKSTISDHWTSIGSSILESTRIDGVERVFLTFGKLGSPVRFLSRPYEECLSGIAVTHYPRYQIDMRLKPGETIFDKMNISYDELRQMENPVIPVSQYYRSKLGPGERLWWATNDTDEESAPATVRLWSALSKQEKYTLSLLGYVYFPEIFGSSSDKYQKCALWLAVEKGVVSTNIRDQFSAGGKIFLDGLGKVPAVFGRLNQNSDSIREIIDESDSEKLNVYWGQDIRKNRLKQWCNLVVSYSESTDFGKKMTKKALEYIFEIDL